LLLPFVDQTPLFNVYDPTNPSSYYNNSTTNPGLGAAIVPVFLCPSDASGNNGQPHTRQIAVSPVPPPYQTAFDTYYASCNYVVNGMVVGNNAGRFPQSFSDGTSNTILYAERYQICNSSVYGGVETMWACGGWTLHVPAFAYDYLLGIGAPSGPMTTGMFTPNLPLSVNAANQVVGHIAGAGAATTPAPFQVVPASGACDPTLPQTPHFAGMTVALADGSVRTILPSISQFTFWAAVTPAGGEVLGADW
jgi:hypothetical protein